MSQCISRFSLKPRLHQGNMLPGSLLPGRVTCCRATCCRQQVARSGNAALDSSMLVQVTTCTEAIYCWHCCTCTHKQLSQYAWHFYLINWQKLLAVSIKVQGGPKYCTMKVFAVSYISKQINKHCQTHKIVQIYCETVFNVSLVLAARNTGGQCWMFRSILNFLDNNNNNNNNNNNTHFYSAVMQSLEKLIHSISS